MLRPLFSIGVLHIKRKRRAQLRWAYNLLGRDSYENNVWQSGYLIVFVFVGTVSGPQLQTSKMVLIFSRFRHFCPTQACTIPDRVMQISNDGHFTINFMLFKHYFWLTLVLELCKLGCVNEISQLFRSRLHMMPFSMNTGHQKTCFCQS